MQPFTCLSNQVNQRFNLNGPIRHRTTGFCLSRPTADEINGHVPSVSTCTGSAEQSWEYYFK